MMRNKFRYDVAEDGSAIKESIDVEDSNTTDCDSIANSPRGRGRPKAKSQAGGDKAKSSAHRSSPTTTSRDRKRRLDVDADVDMDAEEGLGLNGGVSVLYDLEGVVCHIGTSLTQVR
jgi:hypothetical protein